MFLRKGIIKMTKLSEKEMRVVDGGASKYVKCPICGYKKKTSLFERLFQSNARVSYYMSARHLSAFGGYKSSPSVHR